MNPTDALAVLGFPKDYTPTQAEIGGRFRKLALEWHPDKNRNNKIAEEQFKKINEAYDFLTNKKPDSNDSEAEFSPNWEDVIGAEFIQGGDELARPDKFKPSIKHFFLSLDQKLNSLEKKITQRNPDKYIEEFEGISLEQQAKNKDYVLNCIKASKEISHLLQIYINTKNSKNWIPDAMRKINLAVALEKQFKIFGDKGILQVSDANSLDLAYLLLNYLVFLRRPLLNFKSTEDKLHLNLLEDVSEKIKHYHNKLLKRVSKYYDAKICPGTGLIQEKTDSCRRELNSKNHSIEELKAIKEKILNAKEYVMNHCCIPNGMSIFDIKKPTEPRKFGGRGLLFNTVMESMLLFNEKIAQNTDIEELDTGYKGYDLYIIDNSDLAEDLLNNWKKSQSLLMNAIIVDKKEKCAYFVRNNNFITCADENKEKIKVGINLPPELAETNRQVHRSPENRIIYDQTINQAIENCCDAQNNSQPMLCVDIIGKTEQISSANKKNIFIRQTPRGAYHDQKGFEISEAEKTKVPAIERKLAGCRFSTTESEPSSNTKNPKGKEKQLDPVENLSGPITTNTTTHSTLISESSSNADMESALQIVAINTPPPREDITSLFPEDEQQNKENILNDLELFKTLELVKELCNGIDRLCLDYSSKSKLIHKYHGEAEWLRNQIKQIQNAISPITLTQSKWQIFVSIFHVIEGIHKNNSFLKNALIDVLASKAALDINLNEQKNNVPSDKDYKKVAVDKLRNHLHLFIESEDVFSCQSIKKEQLNFLYDIYKHERSREKFTYQSKETKTLFEGALSDSVNDKNRYKLLKNYYDDKNNVERRFHKYLTNIFETHQSKAVKSNEQKFAQKIQQKETYNTIIEDALIGIKNYIDNQKKHSSFFGDGKRDKTRAELYKKLLENKSYSSEKKLIILYALLASDKGKILQHYVFSKLNGNANNYIRNLSNDFDLVIKYPKVNNEFNDLTDNLAENNKLIIFSPLSNKWEIHWIDQKEDKKHYEKHIVDMTTPIGKHLRDVTSNNAINKSFINKMITQIKKLMKNHSIFNDRDELGEVIKNVYLSAKAKQDDKEIATLDKASKIAYSKELNIIVGKIVGSVNNEKLPPQDVFNQHVILLDVDGTLVNSKGKYNEALIKALKNFQKEDPKLHIVLFTSYEGQSIADKAKQNLTRFKILNDLKTKGLNIEATLISGSNQYEKSSPGNPPKYFGSYYEEVFKPIDNELLNVKDNDSVIQVLNGHSAELTKDKYFIDANKGERNLDTSYIGGDDNKEPMFRHALKHFGKDASYLVLDDQPAVIEAAKLLWAEGHDLQGKLTTILGFENKLETEKSYLDTIRQRFSSPLISTNPNAEKPSEEETLTL